MGLEEAPLIADCEEGNDNFVSRQPRPAYKRDFIVWGIGLAIVATGAVVHQNHRSAAEQLRAEGVASKHHHHKHHHHKNSADDAGDDDYSYSYGSECFDSCSQPHCLTCDSSDDDACCTCKDGYHLVDHDDYGAGRCSADEPSVSPSAQPSVPPSAQPTPTPEPSTFFPSYGPSAAPTPTASPTPLGPWGEEVPTPSPSKS